jgi:hypothetical protein
LLKLPKNAVFAVEEQRQPPRATPHPKMLTKSRSKRYERLIKAADITSHRAPQEAQSAKRKSSAQVARLAEAKRRKIEGDTTDPVDDDGMTLLVPKTEPAQDKLNKQEPPSACSQDLLTPTNVTPYAPPTFACSPRDGGNLPQHGCELWSRWNSVYRGPEPASVWPAEPATAAGASSVAISLYGLPAKFQSTSKPRAAASPVIVSDQNKRKDIIEQERGKIKLELQDSIGSDFKTSCYLEDARQPIVPASCGSACGKETRIKLEQVEPMRRFEQRPALGNFWNSIQTELQDKKVEYILIAD